MNQQSLIPKFFQSTFDRYQSLQTDEEKAKFWEIWANENAGISPETLNQHLIEGLRLLSERTNELYLKVKAQQPV
jgi:hypothetical protein